MIKKCKCGSKKYRYSKICKKCYIIQLKEYPPAKGNIRMDVVEYNKKNPKKGKSNGMFNKHHTLKTKIKISIKKLGVKLSSSTKQKISKSTKGKNNPMYNKHHNNKTRSNMSLIKGGTGIPYENSKYPQKFNELLRNKIRSKDGNKCKLCGMTKKEHFKKYNRNLEVHHKDHDRNNCKESNLETRCKQCNIRDNHDY